MTEHPNRPENKLLILLLHGIRTDAAWQQRVRSTIQRHAPDATIIPVKYDEYFDALRFLCPVGTRGRAIDRVTKAIRDAVATYPGRDLILIAHSFGTYAIAKAIQRNADIRPKRLLLAGSIVKQSFDWAAFRGTIDVLNDCGSFDIWPILAKSTTWGYGASGTLGFGSPVVTDRYFPFRHSDFFDHEKDPSFIETHWVPWIVAGVKTESTFESQRPAIPWHLLILTTVFQIKYVLPLIVAMILYWHGYIPAMPSTSWFSSDPGWCEGIEPLDEDLFPDPRTAAPDFVTQEQIAETPAVSDSESYTLRYYNDTDADYRLLLLTFRRSSAGFHGVFAAG